MKWRANTIIFDLDGVLVNSGRDIANAVNFTLGRLGLRELPTEKIVSFMGPGMEEILRNSIGLGADRFMERALRIYRCRYSEFCVTETTLYPGIPETLRQLKSAGKTLAVATNNPEAFTTRILHGLHIDQYFDVMIGPESVSRRKPDPEPINLILLKLKASPETTVVVGDASTDIQAAKAAGTISCGVMYGFGNFDEIVSASPDFMIAKASELPNYIA